ncbi:MAG: dihydropteroate synthase [Methylacidiphilales bacterium]|nr:dihydropteroate synthase [Candidatus Methylacidiphilales bacterium]MDW8349603.1 dihydropteroate synthase [Verrucomicrobiae bacterium]
MKWTTSSLTLHTSNGPFIMGIINITPDSFSDGGRNWNEKHALRSIKAMIAAKVDIIDIGGQSTRPGATLITAKEEWRRIHHILCKTVDLAKGKCLISVDTFYGDVAAKALECGADIINDVSGGNWCQDNTWPVIASHPSCGYVLTHSKGTPQTMQINPTYQDVVQEVVQDLHKKLSHLTSLGIHPNRVAIDPGIGFGKTTEHNLTLLNSLQHLKTLKRPILIGLSRKRFLREILGIPLQSRKTKHLSQLDQATQILNALLTLKKAAHIWRVHNTDQAQIAAQICRTLSGSTKINLFDKKT